MTTPLFLLRCVQMGLSMEDLEHLSIGLVNDLSLIHISEPTRPY